MRKENDVTAQKERSGSYTPKGVSRDAFANSGTAGNLSNQLTTNAANIYGGLEPTLAAESAHPSGLTPIQKAEQNTAAQQSAGGGTAGAIGAGRLYSARTRNAGGAKNAIGAATRGAGQNLSNAALSTEQQNAALQQRNQQTAQGRLQSLQGEQLGAGEQALGLSNQALGVASKADEENPWNKYGQIALSALLNPKAVPS